MTPDQYRREGFRAGIEAAKEACENIIKNYDVMEPGKPDQYASRKTQYAAKSMVRLAIQEISAIDLDEVLAGLRPRCAECDCEDGNCTWIKAGPDAVAGRPCTDCGQTHDTDGDICPTCVCVRAEIAAMEKEQCQVSTGPATGATTNGLHGSGADAPVAGDNNHPDAVARLMVAARQRDGGSHDDDCKSSRKSNPFCNCGHDDLMSALAAMENQP